MGQEILDLERALKVLRSTGRAGEEVGWRVLWYIASRARSHQQESPTKWHSDMPGFISGSAQAACTPAAAHFAEHHAAKGGGSARAAEHAGGKASSAARDHVHASG